MLRGIVPHLLRRNRTHCVRLLTLIPFVRLVSLVEALFPTATAFLVLYVQTCSAIMSKDGKDDDDNMSQGAFVVLEYLACTLHIHMIHIHMHFVSSEYRGRS